MYGQNVHERINFICDTYMKQGMGYLVLFMMHYGAPWH